MTIEDLKKGIEGLKPDELAKFRAWYEQFDAALFDAKIERDAHNGTLDRVLAKSEEDFRAGRFREI
jgi:hypothetical protein